MSFTKDIISCVVFSILVCVLSYSLQEVPEQGAYYPRVLLVILSVLILSLVFTGFRSQKSVKKAEPEPDANEHGGNAPGVSGKANVGAVLVLAFSLAYLLLLPFIGFIFASAFLLISFMVCLGVRSLPVLILVPLVEIGALWFVFERTLAVLLPGADGIRTLFGI